MTLLRSEDGRFFEIDEKQLKKFQVKAGKPSGRKKGPVEGPQPGPGPVRIIIQVPPGAQVGYGGPEAGGRMIHESDGSLHAPGRGGRYCVSATCGVRG